MVVDFVFRYHGRRRILSDHKSGADAAVFGQKARKSFGKGRIDQPLRSPLGYVGQLGYGHLHEIEGQSHRLPVEVSAGDDLILIGEYQRIVGHRVDFPGNGIVYITDRIS